MPANEPAEQWLLPPTLTTPPGGLEGFRRDLGLGISISGNPGLQLPLHYVQYLVVGAIQDMIATIMGKQLSRCTA
jgi:hypothetical protein